MQEMLVGFITSQALFVVAELGVADELVSGPRTVQELASAVGAEEDRLRRLVRYLASHDVFRREGDTVELTELGRTLVSGTGTALSRAARGVVADGVRPPLGSGVELPGRSVRAHPDGGDV